MLIRFPTMPTLILSALILTTACPGCARRNILFESKKDLMPCDEYGGKVSMAMRGEPVTPDKGIMPHRVAMPVTPALCDPLGVPQPLPPVHQSPTDQGPVFFAPPSLGPPQGPGALQTGFDSSASTDNTVFASYPGLPSGPAYSPTSQVDSAPVEVLLQQRIRAIAQERLG